MNITVVNNSVYVFTKIDIITCEQYKRKIQGQNIVECKDEPCDFGFLFTSTLLCCCSAFSLAYTMPIAFMVNFSKALLQRKKTLWVPFWRDCNIGETMTALCRQRVSHRPTAIWLIDWLIDWSLLQHVTNVHATNWTWHWIRHPRKITSRKSTGRLYCAAIADSFSTQQSASTSVAACVTLSWDIHRSSRRIIGVCKRRMDARFISLRRVRCSRACGVSVHCGWMSACESVTSTPYHARRHASTGQHGGFSPARRQPRRRRLKAVPYYLSGSDVMCSPAAFSSISQPISLSVPRRFHLRRCARLVG